MQRVTRPWLRSPNDAVVEHRGEVAAPSRSVPTNALQDEFPIAVEGGRRVRFRGGLDLDFPATVDQPTGEAIIVIGFGKINVKEPLLVRKVVCEGFVLEDWGTNCGSPAGETCNTTIDVGCCCDGKVPAFEVRGAKEIPDVKLDRSFKRDQRPDGANGRVLERGQKIGEEGLGPEDVIIGEYGDGSLDVIDTLDHL